LTTIRQATTSDNAMLAEALGSAFSDDPLFRWIAGAAPRDSIEAKLRVVFGKLAGLELSRSDHLVFTSDDGVGAAVWKHPNRWKMTNGDMLRALPAMLRAFGTKTPRMIGAFNAVEKVHPTGEHYFLEALGTRRDMQGKGVGSAVLGPMLDRCDTEGMPAYLESSNSLNVPFYARHGFEVTGEIAVGRGAPRVTAMWRDPR
jgi:GNAT superfamily N-acetyltransferase